MSIPNDLSAYEKMNNMKNMLGGSFIEYLKPNIKSKQNESVLKMLEIAKDKPETYLELLAVAIFHQNFEIIKYMVEKFKIMETDSPYMKASSFFNSIIPDDSEDKINDGKEYIDIQVPFVLMSGIGGDIAIFRYLLNHKLISKKSRTGVIGLSKKFKNAFSSNIVGACAYYGKSELLEFLLKSYKSELDVNILTTEKKSKNAKYNIPKELAKCTPALLAVNGPSSDEKTLEILKILKNSGANFECVDFNEDNLLHIATRNKKINTAKYLLDELKLKHLVGESNKDGYTPLSLAQHLNDDVFISYYSDKNEVDEKEIEENLKELIQDSDNKVKQSKKNKKNKKKGKDEPTLLNTTEYQESLKVEKKNDEESNNSSKLHDLLDKQKPKKKKQKNNDDNERKKEEEKEEENEEEKEEKEEETTEKTNKKTKNNKNLENTENTQSKPSTQNVQNNTNEDDEPIIGLGKKNKKNKKKGGNKNKANDGGNTGKNENQNKEKKEEEKEEEKEKEKEKEKNLESESNKEEKKEKEKSKKEKRVDQDEIDKEKKRKKEELEKKKKEEEEKKKKEEEDEQKRIEQEKEEQRKKEEEEKERERERQREEEQKRKEEEQRKREEEERRREEEERRRKEEEEEERKRKEEEERRRKEEEEEKTEKEELSESEKDNYDDNSSEKEEDSNLVYNEKDYQQLNKNYLELEKKKENLEKEKEELTSCLTKLYLENKNNSNNQPISNTEENINDLIYLANKELENKNNIINDLEEKIGMLDLANIKNFSNEKLKKYKDFYTKNLKIIENALKK